jgi:hypothetical protein
MNFWTLHYGTVLNLANMDSCVPELDLVNVVPSRIWFCKVASVYHFYLYYVICFLWLRLCLDGHVGVGWFTKGP